MNRDNGFTRDRSRTSATRRTFLQTAGAVTALTAIGSVKALAQGYGPTVAAPPQALDLRDYNGKNYVTEVRDQGGCNSCTAYAVVAAIETAKSIRDDTSTPQIHLSEDQLFSLSLIHI